MDMQTCVERCDTCRRACIATAEYSLDNEELAEATHVRILQDCADMCLTASNFMLRNSDSHKDVCDLCAEICERCADDCDEFDDDEALQSCAATCRQCADACRQMAQ